MGERRRIDWSAPVHDVLARLIEVACGWVDGDTRAREMAPGLVDLVRDKERDAVVRYLRSIGSGPADVLADQIEAGEHRRART